MIVYLDNDALLKLVAWDLLDAALDVLGADRKAVRILSTAKFVLSGKRKKDKLQDFGGELTISRLGKILPSLTEVTEEPAGYGTLIDVDSVDEGEAILIGHVAATPAAYLTTGDKRCVRALNDPKLADFKQGLAGKVLCVEGAIEAMIMRNGFDFVLNRVLQCLTCDKVVRSVFGLGLDAKRDGVLEGLGHYLRELPQDLLFQPLSSHQSRQ